MFYNNYITQHLINSKDFYREEDAKFVLKDIYINIAQHTPAFSHPSQEAMAILRIFQNATVLLLQKIGICEEKYLSHIQITR